MNAFDSSIRHKCDWLRNPSNISIAQICKHFHLNRIRNCRTTHLFHRNSADKWSVNWAVGRWQHQKKTGNCWLPVAHWNEVEWNEMRTVRERQLHAQEFQYVAVCETVLCSISSFSFDLVGQISIFIIFNCIYRFEFFVDFQFGHCVSVVCFHLILIFRVLFSVVCGNLICSPMFNWTSHRTEFYYCQRISNISFSFDIFGFCFVHSLGVWMRV